MVAGMVLLLKSVALILSAVPAFSSTLGALATGATVSMLTVTPAEAGLRTPAASLAGAVITCLPSASRLVLTEYAPAAVAAALPTLTPSDRMLTVAPAGAAPMKVGVLTLVMLSPATPESLAAASFGVDGAASGVAPVPLSATMCGPPGALSLKVRLPLAVPVAVGVNVTLTLQDAAAATLAPQVLRLMANGPEMVTLASENGALPVLLSVADCGALVVVTAWPPKVRLVGLTLATGVGVVAVTLTVATTD